MYYDVCNTRENPVTEVMMTCSGIHRLYAVVFTSPDCSIQKLYVINEMMSDLLNPFHKCKGGE